MGRLEGPLSGDEGQGVRALAQGGGEDGQLLGGQPRGRGVGQERDGARERDRIHGPHLPSML